MLKALNTKLETDLTPLDDMKELKESEVHIVKAIHAIKLKFDKSDNRKVNVEINSEVIQLIELIKESDMFKVAMMSSLQREVKRSFLPFEFSLNKHKEKISPFFRAKLQENVNSCLAKVIK